MYYDYLFRNLRIEIKQLPKIHNNPLLKQLLILLLKRPKTPNINPSQIIINE